jgi:two-component system cell cycle sensor histidine kinase/response regulator CckA
MHLRDMRDRFVLSEENLQLERRLSEGQRLEAVGTLAAGIAHQFNNLLMMIVGYAELARDHEPGDQKLISNIERILAACDRAATLVEKMTQLASRNDLVAGEAPVRETLTRVLASLRGHLPAHAELRDEVSAETVVAMAPSELETVLQILLSNAADAVREAGGKITVRAEPCSLGSEDFGVPPGNHSRLPGVRILVEDTGPGIDSEVLKHVFEPFFTTKDVGLGDGLGLSVARAIVQRHGGRIEIQTLPAQGTSVEVLLKAA